MTRAHSLFDLSGKVALVTGGSRGLGLQIAEALGSFGARVVIVARKQGELDEAAAGLAAMGIAAESCAADLAVRQGAQDLVDRVLAMTGRVDVLVNNAGATWGAPAEAYPDEAWDKVISLNLDAVFSLTREVAQRSFFGLGAGVVLNISSIEALIGHPPDQIGTVAYNTSKAGLLGMTRALAAEWGPRNIRVNALAPGYFPTKMTAGTLEEHGARMLANTPLGRLGGECDIMGPALLLASDAGRHITGQVIVVDGGMTII